MTKYLIFGGVVDYPSGGMDDLIGEKYTIKGALDLIESYESSKPGGLDFWQIYDVMAGRIVQRWDRYKN